MNQYKLEINTSFGNGGRNPNSSSPPLIRQERSLGNGPNPFILGVVLAASFETNKFYTQNSVLREIVLRNWLL